MTEVENRHAARPGQTFGHLATHRPAPDDDDIDEGRGEPEEEPVGRQVRHGGGRRPVRAGRGFRGREQQCAQDGPRMPTEDTCGSGPHLGSYLLFTGGLGIQAGREPIEVSDRIAVDAGLPQPLGIRSGGEPLHRAPPVHERHDQ